MLKVYVTNFTGHEYTDAKRFGELIYITNGYVTFNDLKEIERKVLEFVKQATKDDYLLLSGNSLLCSVATLIWTNYHKQCNILHWNGMKRGYDLHTVINEE